MARSNAEQREYMKAYRVRRKAAGKPVVERTPEQVRAHDWWRKYRLRPEQVQQLWVDQQAQCAVCSTALAAPGQSRNTHIDHCHETGRVRGLLCSHCNLMLGHAKDRPDRLRAAAEYLTRPALIGS